MSPRADEGGPVRGTVPQVLAFYLPQFYRLPENDAWHGPGFTEWTVAARSEPLYAGHRQPHLPGELGFYDLRVPETRELQASLARSHGVSGFLYYHYWFHGRRMLERPFQEVLQSGAPDFPFALCWANESWYRRWQGTSDEMLVEQEYSAEDDLEHIRWLIEAFRDPRYIKIHDRPLLTIYRPESLPEPKRTFDLWSEECARAGVQAPWLVMFETDDGGKDPAELGFDASAEFVPHGTFDLVRPRPTPPDADPTNSIFDYGEVAAGYRNRPEPDWTRYPCVATDWDNTPRRRTGEAMILDDSTPDGYAQWLRHAVRSQSRAHGSDGIVFVNAWNEWAEGAHLEPDTHYGRAYLEKTREVLEELCGPISPHSPAEETSPPVAIEALYDNLYERFVRLQSSSSGLLAYADRRLKSARAEHRAEPQDAREESRRLAMASLLLEERLALMTERYDRLRQSVVPGRTPSPTVRPADDGGNP
jgi:hypothetical protein